MDNSEEDINNDCGDYLENRDDFDTNAITDDDSNDEPSNCQISYFDKIVGHLEDILIDTSFQELQRNFFYKHCYDFESSDENKLSYTDIFLDYVALLEKDIEDRLQQAVPNFNMDTLLRQLKDRRECLDGEVFELLYSLTDFSTFKSLMLDFKDEKEGKNLDFSQALKVVSIQIK